MALIRSLSSIAKKWRDVTPLRSAEYQAGVENPLKNWEKEVLSALPRQKEGMQKALNDGRIEKGIKRAGQAKWAKNASTKGVPRWSEGVALAEPEYASGFSPYHDVIAKTTLPPRYSAGDPRNYDRSKAIGLALHQKKVSG